MWLVFCVMGSLPMTMNDDEKQNMDNTLSLVDPIECIEDIASTEMDDTSLNRARNLERDLDIHQLYIKTKSENPSG